MSKSKILFFLILSIFFQNVALAQDMEPISKFMSENSHSKNGSTGTYVAMRCYTLMSTLQEYLKGNNEEVLLGKVKNGIEVFTQILIKYTPDNYSEKYVITQLDQMTAAYKDKFSKSRALTGSFASDTVISSDISTCFSFLNAK